MKASTARPLKTAEILGISDKMGILKRESVANFIFVSSPPKKKGENIESFLKRLCSPRGVSRSDFKDLVVETFLKGHSRFSHIN